MAITISHLPALVLNLPDSAQTPQRNGRHHAGHADIVREFIDGATGLPENASNLPDIDWQAHCNRVEDAARQADQD
jgi:hypothetical protein